MFLAVLTPLLLLIPQAAAKSDIKTVDPRVAALVSDAIHPLKPQIQFPHLAEQLQAEQDFNAQKAAQEAARQAEAQRLAELTVQTTAARQTYSPLSTNDYKAFIYQHESGNDPARWNSSGCLGLGQACPASKLLAVCPTMDYACEDAWFSEYALSRYGSWASSAAFWQSHNWW